MKKNNTSSSTMKTSSLSRIDEIPAEFTEVISGITDPPYHHQIPPYGKLGQPYVITKHELVYPVVDSAAARYGQTNRYNYQNVRFRPNWSYLQKERLTEQLRRCFPFVYVITHCICVILNSLIQIGLQIALMATNGALWWVGAGIWAGVYFIIMALLTLLLGLYIFKVHYIRIGLIKVMENPKSPIEIFFFVVKSRDHKRKFYFQSVKFLIGMDFLI